MAADKANFMNDIWWYIGAFILILSPIVIVHELGHFWTALYFKIKVNEFGLGFPPRAATLFERNGVKYTLNWIPIGGFVRPAGEDDPTVEGGLASASKTARFCVLVAGAVFNFIFAFFILWFAFMMGESEFRIGIGALQESNVVAEAGIQANDIFVSINGEEIGRNMDFLIEEISSSPNEPVTLQLERDGELLDFTVTPMAHEEDPRRGVLGIALESVPTGNRVQRTPVEAASRSVGTIYQVIALTISAPKMLIEGSLTPQEARPISIVGISQIAGEEAQQATQTGDWFGVLFFAGIINVGLGFTNLLPLPALDGGRIMFVLLEAIRGRRIEPEREGMVHVFGMLLLLGLMAVMIVNDIINPILQ